MAAPQRVWHASVREALAVTEFRHGSRRAFGKPENESVLGTTTFIAREDQATSVIVFVRYSWDPYAPTWAKPIATERLADAPRGAIWKAGDVREVAP